MTDTQEFYQGLEGRIAFVLDKETFSINIEIRLATFLASNYKPELDSMGFNTALFSKTNILVVSENTIHVIYSDKSLAFKLRKGILYKL